VIDANRGVSRGPRASVTPLRVCGDLDAVDGAGVGRARASGQNHLTARDQPWVPLVRARAAFRMSLTAEALVLDWEQLSLLRP
jgi:hypothetical protein